MFFVSRLSTEKYFTTLTKAFIFVDSEELRFENSLERLSRRNDWDCRKIELRWHLYKISVRLLYLNIHAFCVRKHASADMHTHFSRPKIHAAVFESDLSPLGTHHDLLLCDCKCDHSTHPRKMLNNQAASANSRLNVINFANNIQFFFLINLWKSFEGTRTLSSIVRSKCHCMHKSTVLTHIPSRTIVK